MVSLFLHLTIFLVAASTVISQQNGANTHVIVSNTTIVCPSTNIDELKEVIVQMGALFATRLQALESRLSCASNSSVPQVTNSTVIPPASQLAEEIYQNLTISNRWSIIYDQPYSHRTTVDELRNVSSRCSGQVLVGARRNVTDPRLTLAAVGPVRVLQTQTVLNTTTKYGNVYWYLTALKSFGFSPNSIINQNIADYQTTPPELRLSWHLNGSSGGYRAGASLTLDNDGVWRKVIFCLN